MKATEHDSTTMQVSTLYGHSERGEVLRSRQSLHTNTSKVVNQLSFLAHRLRRLQEEWLVSEDMNELNVFECHITFLTDEWLRSRTAQVVPHTPKRAVICHFAAVFIPLYVGYLYPVLKSEPLSV